ncbi:unnamed protein product [Schistocephalus solidus]|uniref:Protein kinase domain-containing protein n=1 Tax=Schistocephalus solidus TaxID=70667 RepID=A0A183SNU1_SCHSO|nr:unnamed protein product [Schistocephalus solidus]
MDFDGRTTILQELERNKAILTVDSLQPSNASLDNNLQVIPVAMAAFSFVYNLPGPIKASELVLGLKELAGIYDGSLIYWDDPRIRKLNPCKFGSYIVYCHSLCSRVSYPIQGSLILVVALSLSHTRIILVLRDDKDLSNLVLTAFLSTSSLRWKQRYGALNTFKNWKSAHPSLHTFHPTGVVNLVNAVPYTLGYLLAYEPNSLTMPLVHIILSNGQLVNPTPETCEQTVLHGTVSRVTEAIALFINDGLPEGKTGGTAVMATPPYPLVVSFRAFVRRRLDTPPYPIPRNETGSPYHFTDACRLQVELYGFLHWLLHSRVADSILRSRSLFTQSSRMVTVLDALTCVNGPVSDPSQPPSAAVVEIVSHLYAKQRETELAMSHALEDSRRDLILTLCFTVVIVLVVLLLLLRHLRIHRFSTWRFLVDMEELKPLDPDSHLLDGVRQMQDNIRLYEKVLANQTGGWQSQHSLQSIWIYADTFFSTAPAYRTYHGNEVLLYPTNMTTSARFAKDLRENLQHYLEIEHENVQSFLGLSKVSEQRVISRKKASVRANLIRKLQMTGRFLRSKSFDAGGTSTSTGRQLNYPETDFILPWIYYSVVDECVRGSLFELLHSGQYEICQPLKLTLASDIAGGMAYLHSKQLIHGHLSSMNCLLDSRWVLKIASWQRITELLQPGGTNCLTPHADSIRATRCAKKIGETGHSACSSVATRPLIRVAEKPMYLRIMWKSPAQLRAYIASSTGVDTKKTTQSVPDPEYLDLILRKRGQTETFEQRAVFRTYACDVYSFGVILTEIWSLEVPFQDSLSSFSHEVQLAEAIALGTVRLTLPVCMPSRIRQVTEACLDHMASVRPKFRNILNTLASLVPAGRSIGHHMLRAANIRTNDLKSNIAVEHLEISRQRQRLCNKLDNLFPMGYYQKIIVGLPPPETELHTVVVCVVGLVQTDRAPVLGTSEGDHMLEHLLLVKAIAEQKAAERGLRMLTTPGGLGHEGFSFVSADPGVQLTAQIIDQMLKMISEVRQEFRFRLPSALEACSVNAAVHMAAAFTGLSGVHLPRAALQSTCVSSPDENPINAIKS